MYLHKVASNNSVGKVTSASPSSVEGLSFSLNKQRHQKTAGDISFWLNWDVVFSVEEPEKIVNKFYGVEFAEEKFGSDVSRTMALRNERKLIGCLYQLSDYFELARYWVSKTINSAGSRVCGAVRAHWETARPTLPDLLKQICKLLKMASRIPSLHVISFCCSFKCLHSVFKILSVVKYHQKRFHS